MSPVRASILHSMPGINAELITPITNNMTARDRTPAIA